MEDHPLRRPLNEELHARPALPVRPGSTAVHFALLGLSDPEQALRTLCAGLHTAEPSPGTRQAILEPPANWPAGWIVWEHHTEFITLTVLIEQQSPFATIEDRLPAGWLAGLDGTCLVAARLAIIAGDGEDLLTPAADFLPDCGGSLVSGGHAAVWSDFRLAEDGYSRLLVHDFGLTPQRLGRLVRRLVELETYRMMALLALPVAHQAASTLSALESGLLSIGEDLCRSDTPSDDHALLDRLTGLAARHAHLAAASDFRFAAAAAYTALVERRLSELREERIEGLQRLGSFLERRFTPAMRTVAATSARLERLAGRIATTTDLLRTRVGVAQEEQNRALLSSMERRAALQLHLQETVEGLSVAAISYYMIGLWKYLVEAGKAFGLSAPPPIANGVAIPIIVGAIWIGIRRLRRAAHHSPPV